MGTFSDFANRSQQLNYSTCDFLVAVGQSAWFFCTKLLIEILEACLNYQC